MSELQDLESFRRLIAAIEPWLPQVVIVGGWAHQLYRLHPVAQDLSYQPLTTLDTDVAVPTALPAGGENIRERLLAHGFVEEFLGDNRPPATHYHLGNTASGFYAEFLTPLTGSEYDRKQQQKATIDVSGVVSQRLRYIELLLQHPWTIDLALEDRMAEVQIANPVSFVAQKVLIQGKRNREDRAKDILYMHDTLEVFANQFAELQGLWRHHLAPDLPTRAASQVSKAAGSLFGTVTDDVRRAAEIAAARALSPEAIRAACGYGFSQVFGKNENESY